MKFEIHNNWILIEFFIAIQLKLRPKSYNYNVTFARNILKTFHKLPTFRGFTKFGIKMA